MRGKHLLLANDSAQLDKILTRLQSPPASPTAAGLTYTAVFRHSPEQQKNFNQLFTRLDKAQNNAATGEQSPEGQEPPFFSGNIASLDRMFSAVTEERVEERDQGAKVLQTVTYQWKR